MSKLAISHLEADGRHTLVLSGELDLASAGALEAEVLSGCEARSAEVVIDLDGVHFIDSSGVRAVFEAQALCRRCGCGFGVIPGRHPGQRRMFEIAGMLDVLPFHAPRSRLEI
jgi:anti-sigma B factor antagonist